MCNGAENWHKKIIVYYEVVVWRVLGIRHVNLWYLIVSVKVTGQYSLFSKSRSEGEGSLDWIYVDEALSNLFDKIEIGEKVEVFHSTFYFSKILYFSSATTVLASIISPFSIDAKTASLSNKTISNVSSKSKCTFPFSKSSE